MGKPDAKPKRSIRFEIPWTVRPKQGDRTRTIIKDGRARTHHHRDPKVDANAKALVLLASQHRPAEPLEGPLSVNIGFYFPWRKSDSRRARSRDCAWKDTRPDLDNLGKQIVDALEAAGFFVNDSQVARTLMEKSWCATPHVSVFIEELGNG